MAAESSTASRPTNPLPSRSVRLIRVGVLVVAGIVIAFSATMHEQLGFDTAVTAAAIGAVGVAHGVEWFSLRGSGGSPVAALLALAAVIAAVVLPMTSSVIAFAVVVAAWALVSALLEFLGMVTRPGTRQDAALLGALGVLLALLVLLVREDQVAILGFFGAYAIFAGVFLGISAFDAGRSSHGAGGTDAVRADPTPAQA